MKAMNIKVLSLGAVDYITKPISPAIVRARVKTHLSLVQAEQLKQAHVDLVQRLGRAAEYKDTDTGEHIVRMSQYSKVLALALGMDEQRAELLRQAAPMHDVGKIGIPDAILLKPGKLTSEEFDHMKKARHNWRANISKLLIAIITTCAYTCN